MNKKIRIIPKLEIKNNNLIKDKFRGIKSLGQPINFAGDYFNQGADEIFYIDSVASLYGTNNLTQFVKNTSKKSSYHLLLAEELNLHDIEEMLKNGADKGSINSAGINNIKFIESF